MMADKRFRVSAASPAAVEPVCGPRWELPVTVDTLARQPVRRPVAHRPIRPRRVHRSAAVGAVDVRPYEAMGNLSYLSYEEFGRKFFEVAVTEERVAAAFAAIAGDEFEMPTMRQGPGKIARVSAKVKVQQPQVSRDLADTITFAIHIPLTIELLVDLRLDKQWFTVAGDIALHATARAAEPLLLIIDVTKPRPSDITVQVSSRSIRGEVLRIVAGVDAEIRRFVAAYVADEIDSPASQGAQNINVAELIDTSWTGI